MYQYRWTVMKTGANTRGHSDRKMLCPALPTDSCDSWIEAWREKNSHLQLAPISPAGAACCSLQRPRQLLAKIQKPDRFHSSLACRTGCTHSATDSTDSAACSEAVNWMPTFACFQKGDKSPPNSIFLLTATIRRATTCPLLSHTALSDGAHVSHTDVWTWTPACFTSITDKSRRYF